MIKFTQEALPAYAEYNDVPFLIYIDNDHVEAVNDVGVISTKLPEIVHEGREITREEFKALAEKRNLAFDNGDKYKEVLEFAQNL
jgi:hypothetical protein